MDDLQPGNTNFLTEILALYPDWDSHIVSSTTENIFIHIESVVDVVTIVTTLWMKLSVFTHPPYVALIQGCQQGSDQNYYICYRYSEDIGDDIRQGFTTQWYHNEQMYETSYEELYSEELFFSAAEENNNTGDSDPDVKMETLPSNIISSGDNKEIVVEPTLPPILPPLEADVKISGGNSDILLPLPAVSSSPPATQPSAQPVNHLPSQSSAPLPNYLPSQPSIRQSGQPPEVVVTQPPTLPQFFDISFPTPLLPQYTGTYTKFIYMENNMIGRISINRNNNRGNRNEINVDMINNVGTATS